MLPTLARLRTDAPRYRSAYLQAVNQLLLVTQPGIVFAIATADILIPILLGQKWTEAAPIFQWMGLAALLQPISGAANWLFISQQRSKALAGFGAFNAAISTGSLLRRLAMGTAWSSGLLFRCTSTLTVPGHVLDGDANRRH